MHIALGEFHEFSKKNNYLRGRWDSERYKKLVEISAKDIIQQKLDRQDAIIYAWYMMSISGLEDYLRFNETREGIYTYLADLEKATKLENLQGTDLIYHYPSSFMMNG